jgi:hypothetical protein
VILRKEKKFWGFIGAPKVTQSAIGYAYGSYANASPKGIACTIRINVLIGTPIFYNG